uniref:U73-Liphistoxin-Lsp1a_1 n=1 Tax=Liphistius sp. SGP-2016 TaxID=1905180 RepID=A0A4Q8K284_9ARAC
MKLVSVLCFVSFMVLVKSWNQCSNHDQCGGDECCTWSGTQNQWYRGTPGSCIPKNDTACYCGQSVVNVDLCPCPVITICLLPGLPLLNVQILLCKILG